MTTHCTMRAFHPRVTPRKSHKHTHFVQHQGHFLIEQVPQLVYCSYHNFSLTTPTLNHGASHCTYRTPPTD
jgi:hypothetical protein